MLSSVGVSTQRSACLLRNDTLAAGAQRALDAIRGARSQLRGHVWNLAGQTAPDAPVP